MSLRSQIDSTLRLAKELQRAKRAREQTEGELVRAEELKFGPVIDSLELEIRNRPPRDFHDDSYPPYSYQSEHDQAMREQEFEKRR